ncbi:MAG: hypothetical protein WCA22_20420 [Candidatus Binatus sp.]
MSVPLYLKIFNTYKGGPLPKDDDLEAVIESFGVASKQTKRARQTFQRSAEQAKVFNEKKDRLVLPAGVSLDLTTPNGGKGRKMEQTITQTSTGEINPLLASLLEELPASGEWSREEHDLWARVFWRTVEKLVKIKE